jgi:hypothetical protein
VVIEELPGHERSRRELGCSRQLVRKAGDWIVKEMKRDGSEGA